MPDEKAQSLNEQKPAVHDQKSAGRTSADDKAKPDGDIPGADGAIGASAEEDTYD